MPTKSKRQNALVAPELIGEGPVIPVHVPFTMEERDELSAILSKPVFVKAWRNAEAQRPPVFLPTSEQIGRKGDNHAAKALCRLQGWELHKAALLRQTQEVVPRTRVELTEYPSSGSLEAEVARNLPKPVQKPTQPKSIKK